MKWREKKNPSNLGQNHQTLEIINSSVCYCNVDLRKKKKKRSNARDTKKSTTFTKICHMASCKWWM